VSQLEREFDVGTKASKNSREAAQQESPARECRESVVGRTEFRKGRHSRYDTYS
jgi:hypothetical protein